MTEELRKKLNTTGAFDEPWLVEKLRNWSAKDEQMKADFMEHMYQCSGRDRKDHPMHALYTGLWQDFCLNEAGVAMRYHYYEALDAIKRYEEMESSRVRATVP
jgi:hypothetical protein